MCCNAGPAAAEGAGRSGALGDFEPLIITSVRAAAATRMAPKAKPRREGRSSLSVRETIAEKPALGMATGPSPTAIIARDLGGEKLRLVCIGRPSAAHSS